MCEVIVLHRGITYVEHHLHPSPRWRRPYTPLGVLYRQVHKPIDYLCFFQSHDLLDWSTLILSDNKSHKQITPCFHELCVFTYVHIYPRRQIEKCAWVSDMTQGVCVDLAVRQGWKWASQVSKLSNSLLVMPYTDSRTNARLVQALANTTSTTISSTVMKLVRHSIQSFKSFNLAIVFHFQIHNPLGPT